MRLVSGVFLAFWAGTAVAGSVRHPQSIGRFGDWVAATHHEAGRTACYAFTRVRSSAPRLPGRGDVVLTVTEREHGRDAVAVSAGFAFASHADATVTVGGTHLAFYVAGRSAFARAGHAAVAAFTNGADARARLSAPHGGTVTDNFSLDGFAAAYAAIVKACPA